MNDADLQSAIAAENRAAIALFRRCVEAGYTISINNLQLTEDADNRVLVLAPNLKPLESTIADLRRQLADAKREAFRAGAEAMRDKTERMIRETDCGEYGSEFVEAINYAADAAAELPLPEPPKTGA